MLEIFNIDHSELSSKNANELFSLRKKTFKDRLSWKVACIDGMEVDEYDTPNTTYLFAVKDNTVIGSVRFIETHHPNMITHTFAPFFKTLCLPQGNFIESSRFFVDKARARDMVDIGSPLTTLLFLAMVNYARKFGYEGILTIVSHPMLTLLKRSGWQVSIIEQGVSEKQERVYLLHLPVDRENQNALIQRIHQHPNFTETALKNWPLSLAITSAQV